MLKFSQNANLQILCNKFLLLEMLTLQVHRSPRYNLRYIFAFAVSPRWVLLHDTNMMSES